MCAETDMDDGSMPAPADAPVSMRTRASQGDGESSDEYEARLNGKVPSPMDFCCRPAFS